MKKIDNTNLLDQGNDAEKTVGAMCGGIERSCIGPRQGFEDC